MAKSAYQKLFESILLENPMLPGPEAGQSTMDQGVSDFIDDGTDEHALDVEGIAQHKDAIVQRFMSKIQAQAAKLSPDNIKSATFGEIKDNVDSIFKEIDKVNNFAGAKVDQLNNNAPAIIAATIAPDPTKKAAFEKLHGELSEFSTVIEELTTRFTSLNTKIKDFVGDVSSPSEVKSQPQ